MGCTPTDFYRRSPYGQLRVFTGLLAWRRRQASGNSFGDRVPSKLCDFVIVQLVHQLLAVFFHRFDADAQFCGNVLIGPAFGNELEHFKFARSELFGSWVFSFTVLESLAITVS